LIERDGSAWAVSVVAHRDWARVAIPLAQLQLSRSIHIPSPYPGLWNYWRESPASRGRDGDHVHLDDVERLQLTVGPRQAGRATDDAEHVVVESVRLVFTGRDEP
jgi:hypothetical protein